MGGASLPPPTMGMGGMVSGRMGEQGGLRTGWLAAFGTEGYDGEPPLLEELGINFGHIKMKVRYISLPPSLPPSRSSFLPSFLPFPPNLLGAWKGKVAERQRTTKQKRVRRVRGFSCRGRREREVGFYFVLLTWGAFAREQTLTVLNPLANIDTHIMDDSDLAGPILFFLLFGTFLLFSGKVHFGYIYGLALLGSSSLHVILSLMSPPLDANAQAQVHHHHHHHGDMNHAHRRDGAGGAPTGSAHFSSTLTFTRSASVLGYCLLPLVLTSLVGVLVPMDGLFGYVLTAAAITWCTYSSSAMFCAVGRMSGMRGLVAYPLALFYVGFGIMSIFSSRGTGTLAAKTGAVP